MNHDQPRQAQKPLTEVRFTRSARGIFVGERMEKIRGRWHIRKSDEIVAVVGGYKVTSTWEPHRADKLARFCYHFSPPARDCGTGER